MRVPPLLLLAGLLCLVTAVGRSQESTDKEYTGDLSLVRFDMPRGLSDGFAPTRQLATRKIDAADAIDWIDLTLDGKPIFRNSAEEKLALIPQKASEAQPHFHAPRDHVIQPGKHWFRAIDLGTRKHIYTADHTARTGNSSAAPVGRYELWTFPLRISSDGPPIVKNVRVKYRGRLVYSKPGPWRSLTLLLPANEPGSQYELSVDGRAALRFDIGLMQVKLGSPREQLFRVDAQLPGNPVIKIQTPARPERFPNRREWSAAMAGRGKGLAENGDPVVLAGATRWLGTKTPRSPFVSYAMALPYGRSEGFYGGDRRNFRGTPKEYAAHVAELGFDLVFDPVKSIAAPELPNSIESRANALAEKGIRLGLQYDSSVSRPSLQNPALAFLAHTLPDWHAPLYRSLSLTAQRFVRFPNFAGVSVGSSSSGDLHGSSMSLPGTPWGEAMRMLTGHPNPAALASGNNEVEKSGEFAALGRRYRTAYRQYGYFAEALREVSPNLIFTTGALGSDAGDDGTMPPARVMFEGVPVQQARDVNDDSDGRPLHLVALIDRLRSYAPRKRTWALLDNLRPRYSSHAYQRAVAMVLSRGVQGVGTNVVPPRRTGDGDYVREMNGWMRRYGGVLARLEPEATIGIFHSSPQPIATPVDVRPVDEAGSAGAYEDKIAEALFVAHSAGWPARVITYQELLREPLPSSMKVILLVGLDPPAEGRNLPSELEKPLRDFQRRGGRVIADADSFCPVECERPGLRITTRESRSNRDSGSEQLKHHARNIEKLRAAMHGVELPAVMAGDRDTWALPGTTGDVKYIAVLNQAASEKADTPDLLRASTTGARQSSATEYLVPPRKPDLTWNTERPVYDLTLGRQLSPEEMRTADLTDSPVRWYALPPRPIEGVEIAVQTETRGGANPFYEAIVNTIGTHHVRGVPVRISVVRGEERAEVFCATGWPARLPITLGDEGRWRVTATELLAGHSAAIELEPVGRIEQPAKQRAVQIAEPRAIERFAKRKHVALTIALTPDQAKNKAMQRHAGAIEKYYREQGRVVSIRRLAPGDVVESLQPLKSLHRYPQWKTIASDLVLFGTPVTNVLIDDQARGRLLPEAGAVPNSREAVLAYTRSAFVGEYDVLNVLTDTEEGMAAAVEAVVGGRERK